MDNSKLTRSGVYQLGDPIPAKPYRNLYAKWDGKPRRRPRKGEWYLSGAVINAYRAPSDLGTPFHIAVLIRAKAITVYREIRA